MKAFTIDETKLTQVSDLCKVSAARASELLLDDSWGDYCSPEEHQTWLNTAPVSEIAGWLAEVIKGDDAFNADVEAGRI